MWLRLTAAWGKAYSDHPYGLWLRLTDAWGEAYSDHPYGLCSPSFSGQACQRDFHDGLPPFIDGYFLIRRIVQRLASRWTISSYDASCG